MIEWLLGKTGEYLFGPYQSVDSFVSAVTGIYGAITGLGSKIAWPYLLSGIVVAFLVHRAARRAGVADSNVSFAKFVFPKEIYRHPSAKADYRFVAVDLTIKALVYAPLFSGLGALLYRVLLFFGRLVVGAPLVTLAIDNVVIGTALFTVGIVLFADFVFFLAHYLMHRIPVLWPFHEVHHSAEVLTPVTVYRVHPVEELVNVIVASVVTAVCAIMYTTTFGQEVNAVTLYGVNILVFLFLLIAFQLRHSHIWLSYGPVLSRLFISPAQHQIHHSVDPGHWNTNFGFTFAIWDLCLGTLYVPRTREDLRFGVPGSDPRDFATVRALYLLPFRKALRIFRPRAPQDARL